MSGIQLRFFLAWRDFRFWMVNSGWLKREPYCKPKARARDTICGFCEKAMRPARGAHQCSMRNPDWCSGEEPIDDPDLIGEEQAEAETEQSRAGDEPLVQ